MSETLEPVTTKLDQQQLAEQLLAQAKEQGVELVGPNGLPNQLTKNVLETAWTRRWPSTWAMTSMTRPGGAAATRAMAPGPRRCSLRSARRKSRYPGTPTARATIFRLAR